MKGRKNTKQFNAAGPSRTSHPKMAASHRPGKVSFGGVARKVATAHKGKDQPGKTLGGQVKGKAGAAVAHKPSSHKGKGPLGGGSITRKILVTHKSKGKSPTGQKSVAGQGVRAKQPLPASRKRRLESPSVESLPWKRAPVAVTNSKTRKSVTQRTQNPATGSDVNGRIGADSRGNGAYDASEHSSPAVTAMEVGMGSPSRELSKDDPSNCSPLPHEGEKSEGEEWVPEVKHPPAGETAVADATVSTAGHSNSPTEHLRSVGETVPGDSKTPLSKTLEGHLSGHQGQAGHQEGQGHLSGYQGQQEGQGHLSGYQGQAGHQEGQGHLSGHQEGVTQELEKWTRYVYAENLKWGDLH